MTSLELFFDLVFVLAVTQCTGLMAGDPSWTGLAEALAILALLWWSWGGYAWLTSLIDPEEGPSGSSCSGRWRPPLVPSLCVADASATSG